MPSCLPVPRPGLPAGFAGAPAAAPGRVGVSIVLLLAPALAAAAPPADPAPAPDSAAEPAAEPAAGVPAPDATPLPSRARLAGPDLAAVPGAGEDPTRALQALPGVTSDRDGLGGFSVRGGAPGDVLVLLDGVPVATPSPLSPLPGLLDPQLVDSLTLDAGVSPADAPTNTAGVVALRSWSTATTLDARPDDLDGAVDLTTAGARLVLAGPVGRSDALDFAVGARRSYLGVHGWALGGVGLLDTPRAFPEHEQLSARLAWTPGAHALRLTVLHTGAHLAAAADDDRLLPVTGAFTLDDAYTVATLDHAGPVGRADMRSAVSASYATSRLDRGDPTNATLAQLYTRSDLVIPAWDHHTMTLGASAQLREHGVDGPVDDTRAVPTWASVPLGDLGLSTVPLTSAGWEPLAAVYAEHAWEGPVHTRLGVRATWVGRTGEVLPGPSAGIAMPLPTGTVPRIAGGLYHRVVEDPLAVDPVHGNPALGAERAWQLVIGVDQALPIGDGALVRVEGHVARHDDLVVRSDSPDAAATFTNDGTGRDLGVDVAFRARVARVEVDATLSLLRSERTNPLNEAFPDDVVPGHAREAAFGFAVAYEPSPRWRFVGRYELQSGRPTSSMEAGGADFARIAALNDQRMGDRHQLDVRAEWRHAAARVRYAVYVDVLNVPNLRSPLLPTVTVSEGLLAEGRVDQLPIRPLLGARAEF